MSDLWNITPTANVAEVADLVIAGVGVAVSLANLSAARQRAREWAASGRNGAVLLSARTAVRHEALRVGTQACFVVMALAGFQQRVPPTPGVLVYHAALLGAMVLVLAMSLSSMWARRALEGEVATVERARQEGRHGRAE